MVIYDNIYGEYHIDEPILLDLINSAAMQRLKGVLQHGITGLIGITSPVTRFDHSVGALILVKRLGGSLSEQIAALLHDVSHTAFSHVIDYVYDIHNGQSFHDEQKESFLAKCDIPLILEQYGYAWRDFLKDENFPLLEQPAPRLCADRLDYFLRDSIDLGLASDAEVNEALQYLFVVSDRIVTKNVGAARWLAYTYIAADDASWANFREVGLYELTARAIRRGIDIGIIHESDIWETDNFLWQKLLQSDDSELRSYLQLVTVDTEFMWDENQPTFWVGTKLRTIDPDIFLNGNLIPLSTIDSEFAEYRLSYLSSKQGKWPMRVVPPQ